MKQKSKLNYVVRVDLCINVAVIILGIIALLYFRGRYLEVYMHFCENMDISDMFVSCQMLIFVVLVILSFVTDIIYIASKEPAYVVERYAVIWVILKIINIVFFLLSLLIDLTQG